MPKNIKSKYIEREKHLVLWAGVIFFMTLVSFVWIINFKKTFSQTNDLKNKTNSISEVDGIIDSVSQILDETKNSLEGLSNSISVDNTEVVGTVDRDELIDQRIKLEKLISSLNNNLKLQDKELEPR